MRRKLMTVLAGCFVLPALVLSTARADIPAGAKDAEGSSCGKYGTTVEFEATPSDAARKAKKEQKLVFVLHVSGLFEDPKLT